MSTLRTAALAVLLAGCQQTGPVQTWPTDLPTTDTGTRLACGTARPEIQGLSVGGGAHIETGEPTFFLLFLPIDEDGALHLFDLRFWHDLTVDGAVDRSGAPTWVHNVDLAASETAGPYVECGMSAIWSSFHFRMSELGLPFDTPIEVAAEIVDADGLVSDPAITDGCTPTEAATPGCEAP